MGRVEERPPTQFHSALEYWIMAFTEADGGSSAPRQRLQAPEGRAFGSFTPAKYRLRMKIYFQPNLIYLLDKVDLFNINCA
jgi:hypothetical protein